jgi:hypothetical protein
VSDLDRRTLERTAQGGPGDALAWQRYVRALDRDGVLPPPEVGDEVWIEENEQPWIFGGWRGIVTAVAADRTYHARPLDDDYLIPWRMRPCPTQWVRGLALGRYDRVVRLK